MRNENNRQVDVTLSGHMRVVIGYDDVHKEIITNDPNEANGPSYILSYDQFAVLWADLVKYVYPGNPLNESYIITPPGLVLGSWFQGSQISESLASKPVTIDGKWTTSDEWSDASVTMMPTYVGSANNGTAYLYAKHDSSHFYFLVDFVSSTSLSVSDDYASITIDPTHDDGASAQPDDLRFDSQYPAGGIMTLGGLGGTFLLPSGVLIAMSMDTSSNLNQPHEITEFRIPFSVFTVMQNTIGFRATAAHGSGSAYTAVSWPIGSVPNLPSTWGELTLSPTPVPEFTQLWLAMVLGIASVSLFVKLNRIKHPQK